MSLISRLTTWATNQILTSPALNNEFNNVVNLFNNLDAGSTAWTNVNATTSSIGTLSLTTNPLPLSSGGTNNSSAVVNGRIVVTSAGKIVDSGHFLDSTTGLGFSNTASFGIVGSTTNDSAAAGNVGEAVRSAVTNVSAASSGDYGNITSISLTAGDWDVTGQTELLLNGATIADGNGYNTAISVNSGNTTTDHVSADNEMVNGYIHGASEMCTTVSNYRLSLSTTTTVYLKGAITYSLGTPKFNGRISARRMR